MIEDGNFDVLLNCLPNHLHFEFTQCALEKGKHVLCEKPLTLSAEEAQKLSQLAHNQGLLLSEAFYYRFHPQHLAARTLILNQEIGPLKEIQVRYSFQLEEDSKNYRLNKSQGGGALYDVGCYGIDCARFYFGESPWAARGQSKIHSRLAIDTETEFELLFSHKRIAKVFVSLNGPRENSCMLVGERGVIRMDQAFHVKPQQRVVLNIENESRDKTVREIPGADQFALLFDAVAETASTQSSRITFLEDGLENMKALELVRNSVTTIF